jgi:hypothetical protein
MALEIFGLKLERNLLDQIMLSSSGLAFSLVLVQVYGLRISDLWI